MYCQILDVTRFIPQFLLLQALQLISYSHIGKNTKKPCHDGPAVSVLRRAIAEVKQRWLVIGRVSFRASESTLSRWSRLHLQLSAPTNSHWARVVMALMCSPVGTLKGR
jgi:hypothetical protein